LGTEKERTLGVGKKSSLHSGEAKVKISGNTSKGERRYNFRKFSERGGGGKSR